jgi:Ca2+-transporting ATPase
MVQGRQGASETTPQSSKPWYSLPSQDVITGLGSDQSGLAQEEARRRLEKFGYNELEQEEATSPASILLRQFKNVLVVILIAATLMSFALGEAIDAFVILAIVFAIAVLGFFQEYRSERALEALKKIAALTAAVVREGIETEIPARELVQGDIAILSVGDKVPADIRLIEAVNLRVDEAQLTGESVASEKSVNAVPQDTALADRSCMVYAGTVVTYGRGRGVVVSAGQETEFGKIASMMQAAPKVKTPLELRIERVGRLLGAIMVAVAIFALLLGLAKGRPLLEMILWSVSLAVAAVPEALPAVVTGGLAIGVRRMARRNAIVRRLPAVETLGSTTVICSDKTGTMTKGEMTVRRILVGRDLYEVTGAGYEPRGGQILKNGTPVLDDDLILITKIGVLCNDASLVTVSSLRVVGDPTEVALLVVSAKTNETIGKLRSEHPRIFEVPFTSERKLMTTVHRTPDGELLCCMKGALESVLPRCANAYLRGTLVRMDENAVRQIHDASEQMTNDALRVLAFAYKIVSVSNGIPDEESSEHGLIFLGLMGMIDPPREEVKEAIQKCWDAGIKVVMITGDHKGTAEAVAEELGLLNGGRTLTGLELDSLGSDEFSRIVDDVSVYARVSPEHKMRIVEALKEKGHIVAMTGDGVNDAPALKNSDIGIAMGITGTDVTKEAADVVLADDNFASIVAAVEEGRGIYDNIRKYLLFLLSANIGEILIMFLAVLFSYPLPLVAVQILYVNLATDGLPALALGIDPPTRDLMRRRPRDPKLSIFSGLRGWIGGVALLMSSVMIYLFAFALSSAGVVEARSILFTAIILFELAFVFSCRSQSETVLRLGITSNRYLAAAVASQVILLLLIMYTPGLAVLFEVTPMSLSDWLPVILAGVSGFALAEASKVLARAFRN